MPYSKATSGSALATERMPCRWLWNVTIHLLGVVPAAHFDAVGIVVGEMQHDRNLQPDIHSIVYSALVRATAKNVGQDVI
jgi:hypothetical protein